MNFNRTILNNAHGAARFNEMWALRNNSNLITRDAWIGLDKEIVQISSRIKGFEIIQDLQSLDNPVNIGKTAVGYGMATDIADDVVISMDGQPPTSYDTVDFDSELDPIPGFRSGFGVSFRKAEGYKEIGIDLLTESGSAKLPKHLQAMTDYLLYGDAKIKVAGVQGQGFINHRNTIKLNLGSSNGGAGIDLATATPDQLEEFWGRGAARKLMDDNFIDEFDVVWLSPEAYANHYRKIAMIGADYIAGQMGATVVDYIGTNSPTKEFRKSYALKGNEFFGYVRNSSALRTNVGLPTTTFQLPQRDPYSNTNVSIISFCGAQVKKDYNGRSQVIYGGAL